MSDYDRGFRDAVMYTGSYLILLFMGYCTVRTLVVWSWMWWRSWKKAPAAKPGPYSEV